MPYDVMSIGALEVPETISDTGPILHLSEIGRLASLATVLPLQVPHLAWAELQERGIERSSLQAAGIEISVIAVAEQEWQEVVSSQPPGQIQPADAQVFALVRDGRFEALALTDDLALRRLLEEHGGAVVGTVGLLVRAYKHGMLKRAELNEAIEALFTSSTLHLGRAFRAYLRELLKDL